MPVNQIQRKYKIQLYIYFCVFHCWFFFFTFHIDFYFSSLCLIYFQCVFSSAIMFWPLFYYIKSAKNRKKIKKQREILSKNLSFFGTLFMLWSLLLFHFVLWTVIKYITEWCNGMLFLSINEHNVVNLHQLLLLARFTPKMKNDVPIFHCITIVLILFFVRV